jgi:hypothetical protein
MRLFIIIVSLLAAGCAARQPPLYYWGNYQDQVYEHFKAENPEKEIAVLEADLQKARSKGLHMPPGFFAHLGLLYAQLGREDMAMQNFDAEATLYPESRQYMNFLMKKKEES